MIGDYILQVLECYYPYLINGILKARSNYKRIIR
jgi:hypothetical protein